MNKKTIITILCETLVVAILIWSLVTIKSDSDTIWELQINNSDLENSLDNTQTKLATTEQKLEVAENNLTTASKALEELETELIYTRDDRDASRGENEALQTENEYLIETSEYVYNGTWNYNYTYEDVEILAGVMYGENWISGRYEMMLTGSVVLNRVLDERFPNNIHDVVYQFDGGYEQYAPRTKRLIGSSEVPEICYDLARILLDYGPIAPRNVVYQAHFNQGRVFWEWNGEQFCYG